MASVVTTLSSSELGQTVKDEEPCYEKIRAGEGLQVEELARLEKHQEPAGSCLLSATGSLCFTAPFRFPDTGPRAAPKICQSWH